MSILGSVLTVVLTVATMEMVAYSAHRWVMHGPIGWGWHKSHHEEHDHGFEKNDLFGLVFSLIAILLFVAGGWWWPILWLVAVGMTIYGLIYFVLHDGLVHQRWPFRYVPRRGYFRRLYQAHRLHHAVEGRADCVSFGFIYAPPLEDLKQQLRATGVLERRQSAHRDASGPERDGR